jgi:hypothetical protein
MPTFDADYLVLKPKKRSMKKFLSMIAIASMLAFTWACDDDEETPAMPTVTAPTNVAAVQIANSVDVTYQFTAAGGYKSAAVTAVGGTAVVKTEPEAGSRDGSVVITFTAGTSAGAGSVELSLTDNSNQTAKALAVLNITSSPVPSIAGIPPTASVVAGTKLGPVVATITMANTPGTFTIKKNGANFGSPVNITTNGQTVNFEYTPTIQESGSVITFEFTAEDSDGDDAVATHVLTVTAPVIPKVLVEANITANTTWTKDKIYELATRVTVVNGVTLTIQAGTVIKGQPGTGANATALLIARGGKLIAEGTATEPIIFTSTSDNLIPGQIASPNLAANVNGLWGGLIVLGRARIAATSSEVQIEGIPTTDTNGLYGGSDDADNSGVIKYVSIRHGGSLIGSGNEINGLTLGGVGSGTVIENVEIVANQDDGIEFFGGTVSVKNALVWNSFDDALDTDQSWSGTVDNFVIVAPNTGSGFELDGPEGTGGKLIAGAAGDHKFKNGTVFAGPDIADLIDFDASSNVQMENIYFYGISNNTDVKEYAAMIAFANSTSSVANFQHTLPATRTAAQVFPGVEAAKLTAVNQNANTVGANMAAFSWTWARVSGALASLGL